jgi:hypothetical protein
LCHRNRTGRFVRITVNAPSSTDGPKPDKKRKPARPFAVRGKWNLADFRGFLERVAAHPTQFTDEHIRFVQELLQSLAQDNQGVIRITISPFATNPANPKRRFSPTAPKSDAMPDDDAIRTIAREIALIEDELVAFARIDGLSAEFLQKAAALYSFKSDTHAGLKAAFAGVVADVRQMENIAAARPRGVQPPTAP